MLFFTFAGEPDKMDTSGSVILISSVDLSLYVTVISPPVRSILSPWLYVVLFGFVFTEIDSISFSGRANPLPPNVTSLLTLIPSVLL